MIDDLESYDEIRNLTDELLRRASAYGRLPTPVDDIVSAADLTEPEESVLSNLVLDRAPEYIRRAFARATSKVQALLDRRRREIHLHPDIDHAGQRKFKRLHEVTHDLLPWQQELAYADDESTLSWRTKVLFEKEANQGAAELLFQQDYYTHVAADYAIGLASVVETAQKFGASIRSSFRRYVENHSGVVTGLVLDVSPCKLEPISYRRREVMHSAKFRARFPECLTWPNVLAVTEFPFVEALRGTVNRITTADARLSPRMPLLKVELLNNTYNILVLLWQPRIEWLKKTALIH